MARSSMTNNRGGGGGASNVLTNSKQAIAANANTSTSTDTMSVAKPKVHGCSLYNSYNSERGCHAKSMVERDRDHRLAPTDRQCTSSQLRH